MKLRRLFIAAAAAISVSIGAQAAPVTGTMSLAGFNVSANTSPITVGPPGTIFTAGPLQFAGSATGDFAAIPIPSTADAGPFVLSANIGAPVTFSGAYGTFTGTVTSVFQDTPTANQIAVSVFVVTGMFTPGAAFLALDPTLTANVAQASFSMTETIQNPGPNTSISMSGTLAAGIPVPAPAGLAVLGIGLVGLALFARRRA